jgi:hypothetical protein
MKKIKKHQTKVIKHNFIITTADGGKTLIFMPKNECDGKVVKFVIENSYTEMGHNPREQDRRAISYNLNQNY